MKSVSSAFLALAPLILSGCAPALAASAVSAAARAAQGTPKSNAHLQPEAAKACGDHAARYGGDVRIIDVVQRGTSEIVVWGSVDDGKARRSFKCAFGTKVTDFRLREVKPRG